MSTHFRYSTDHRSFMGMSTDLEQMLAVIDFATEENQLPPRDWEASIAWIQSAETDDLIPLLDAFASRPAPIKKRSN